MDQPLYHYTLQLADTSLIMGHRMSEWTGHGPMLEQDIALTNMALDLIGQSRNFYQYATRFQEGMTEDQLAYLRDSRAFKNLLIAEIPNGDWAVTILKLFFFSAFHFHFYERLSHSADRQLAAIAEKSLKEVTYHLRWSSGWVIRLGDGTEESHRRLQSALEEVWPYTGEMFEPSADESLLTHNNTSVSLPSIRRPWLDTVLRVFEEATLPASAMESGWMQTGGKNGVHTEHLGHILAELQFLQRAYPGCEW